MPDKELQRRLAVGLQKAPWIMSAGHVVWRFLRPKFTAGAVGVIFDTEGRVLIVEHVFHPRTPWGLPGGWVDRHEDPSETLIREMREELQLTVGVGPVLLVERRLGNHLDLAYVCHAQSAVGALSSELLDYRWVDPLELPPQMIPFHRKAIRRALAMREVEQPWPQV